MVLTFWPTVGTVLPAVDEAPGTVVEEEEEDSGGSEKE